MVLGDEGGKGVSKILQGHVGEGIDLDRRRKGRHDRSAETVHQPLHHQNSQIHHRLLQAGQHGGSRHLPYRFPAHAHLLPPYLQLRTFQPFIDEQPHAGKPLGENGGKSRARHAPAAGNHKIQIQHDIDHG